MGVLSSVSGSGRSPGEGNANPLQYPCLENPMDGRVWQATGHRVAKSWTRLSDFTHSLTHSLTYSLPFTSSVIWGKVLNHKVLNHSCLGHDDNNTYCGGVPLGINTFLFLQMRKPRLGESRKESFPSSQGWWMEESGFKFKANSLPLMPFFTG